MPHNGSEPIDVTVCRIEPRSGGRQWQTPPVVCFGSRLLIARPEFHTIKLAGIAYWFSFASGGGLSAARRKAPPSPERTE